MYKVKNRIYGQAVDGRTVLLHRAGATITDDEARSRGLIVGSPKPKVQPRGLTITNPRQKGETDDAAPQLPVDRNTNLATLRSICEDEHIDPGDANTRAEYCEKIGAARAAKAAAGADD